MEEAVAFRPSDSDNICEPEAPPVAAAVPGSARSQPYVRNSLHRDFLSHEAKSHVDVTVSLVLSHPELAINIGVGLS